MFTHEEVHLVMHHLGVYIEKMAQGASLSNGEREDMFRHLDVLQGVSEENFREIAGSCACEFGSPDVSAPSHPGEASTNVR